MNVLSSGSTLRPGDALTSQNGRYRLELQSDGNLVLTGPRGLAWDSDTRGKDVATAEMQADGNFVLYAADRGVVWTADTTGPGAHLVLQDDRNIVIVAADGTTVLWTPNCYVTEAERAAEEQAVAEEQAQQAPGRAGGAGPDRDPRPADLHGPARRHALGDRQALLRPRGRVPPHRRREQHREPGSDPPGPAAGHPGLTRSQRRPAHAAKAAFGALTHPTPLSLRPRAGPDQPASTTFPSSTGDASSGLCGSTRTV